MNRSVYSHLRQPHGRGIRRRRSHLVGRSFASVSWRVWSAPCRATCTNEGDATAIGDPAIIGRVSSVYSVVTCAPVAMAESKSTPYRTRYPHRSNFTISVERDAPFQGALTGVAATTCANPERAGSGSEQAVAFESSGSMPIRCDYLC